MLSAMDENNPIFLQFMPPNPAAEGCQSLECPYLISCPAPGDRDGPEETVLMGDKEVFPMQNSSPAGGDRGSFQPLCSQCQANP